MLGKCFGVICVFSIIFGVFSGNIDEISLAIINGASKSVSLVISLIGIMALWNGVLNVLKEAGIIEKLSRLLKPILKHIFPWSFKNNVATEEITACISANMLGIANAATPLAIRAINKMNENEKRTKASPDMITLAILGCCSFNLVPTTIIAIRSSLGASITYALIVPVWVCSGVCCALGIILSRILGKLHERY
ncbi:MAG: spore maturation protein [Clostridia bacterium]|nr:spore maturation protein [Clostridia bacterium]